MLGQSRVKRVHKNVNHPLIYAFFEANKLIVGRSCQLSLIIIMMLVTELAELRGVLQHPELHARYTTV